MPVVHMANWQQVTMDAAWWLSTHLNPATTKLVTFAMRESLARLAAQDLEALGAISALDVHVWQAALRRLSVAAVKASDALKVADATLSGDVLKGAKRLVEKLNGIFVEIRDRKDTGKPIFEEGFGDMADVLDDMFGDV